MATITDPVAYVAWYHTPRVAWIGDTEFSLLLSLLRPAAGSTLLDVGCGTGYFSRRFAAEDLRVTAIDPDRTAIGFARGPHPRHRVLPHRLGERPAVSRPGV